MHLDPSIQTGQPLLFNHLLHIISPKRGQGYQCSVHKCRRSHICVAVGAAQEVVTTLGGAMLLNELVQVLHWQSNIIVMSEKVICFMLTLAHCSRCVMTMYPQRDTMSSTSAVVLQPMATT